ncbi:hypothetical protein Cgig2_011459 [Carnegiea gigantea]|uniref:Uncharacterized protein n=1 Tax=Carnegiea gigantea TaxID=171969 RepID=A0A9Q1KSL7_9CARY|nr:hypothetical protein Cgig2_011459 [Carnegiea gigantea]
MDEEQFEEKKKRKVGASDMLSFRFMIRQFKDSKKMAEPSEEVDQYDDYMTTDIEEEYAKLTYKMYERRGHLIGSEHFLHVYDPTYILCADCTAKNVASFLRMLSTEDVTIGHWLLDIAMSVQHGDDRAICDPRSSVPTYISCSGNQDGQVGT